MARRPRLDPARRPRPAVVAVVVVVVAAQCLPYRPAAIDAIYNGRTERRQHPPTLTMILAAGFHLTRGEYELVPVNLVLGAVAAFIAVGRWKLRPTAPSPITSPRVLKSLAVLGLAPRPRLPARGRVAHCGQE